MQKLKYGELLDLQMNEKGLNPNQLAEKMSKANSYHNITPDTIRNQRKLKTCEKQPPKEGTPMLLSMAEALDTTQYEYATVNQSYTTDEPIYDDLTQDRLEANLNIYKILNVFGKKNVEILCESYMDLLAIPYNTIDLIYMYSLIQHQEDKEDLLNSIDILLNQSSESENQGNTYKDFEVTFNKLEKITALTVSENEDKLNELDLSDSLREIFPFNEEGNKKLNLFLEYLYFMLNPEWRNLGKKFLCLEGRLKKEMILRIADQMVFTQNK